MKRILGTLGLILLFSQIFSLHVQALVLPDYAEQGIQFDEEGNLIMVTYDGKATVPVTYRTLGWTIKRYPLAMEDTENISITVELERFGERDDLDNPGYQFTYFYFPVEELFDRIGEASPEWQESLFRDGGMLYLDCVMTVCHSGAAQGTLLDGGRTSSGEVYYTYEGIAGARPWGAASLESLKTHFDKEVYFPPHPERLQDPQPELNEEMEYEYFCYDAAGVQPKLSAYIQSDEFEAGDGIPTSEAVYVSAQMSAYGYYMAIRRVSGVKRYQVPVKVSYDLNWTAEDGTAQSDTVFQTYYYTIERAFTYRIITEWKVYTAQKAVITNGVLPDNSMTLLAGAYPEIQIQADSQESAHLVEPEIVTVSVAGGDIEGGDFRPSIPEGDYESEAEESLGEILVRNDYASIDDVIILDCEFRESVTEMARKPEDKQISLTETGIKIPSYKANGEYASIGTAWYQGYFFQCGGTDFVSRRISSVNSVTVHTPVLCRAGISDDKWLNQMTNPVKGKASLILGEKFTISILTEGMHRGIKGYGNREYEGYVNGYQVKFPFTVFYRGKNIDAGVWIDVKKQDEFVLPIEVTEGSYTIQYRTIAENADAVWEGRERMERFANLDMEMYVAFDEITVVVMGRLYGMKITEVRDYPRWQDIFHTPEALLYGTSGYGIGMKNQNGILRQVHEIFTLPVWPGSNPKNPSCGAVKTGYHYGFGMISIGNFYDEEDSILIKKTFDYVNKENGERFAVDLYYSETQNGGYQYLMPLSAELVLHTQSRVLSETSYAMQFWNGEDYLPQKVYAVPSGTQLPLYGIDASVWLKNGYLVVNYQIWARNGETCHLGYLNLENQSEGYCNMWQMEGFQREKTDYNGLLHRLKDGDMIFYDLDHSLLEDYYKVGTH